MKFGEAAVNTGLHSLSAPCVTSRSATSTSLSSPATAMPGGLGPNDALTSKVSFGHAFRMPPLAIQALWPTQSGSGSIVSTMAFRHGGSCRKSDKKPAPGAAITDPRKPAGHSGLIVAFGDELPRLTTDICNTDVLRGTHTPVFSPNVARCRLLPDQPTRQPPIPKFDGRRFLDIFRGKAFLWSRQASLRAQSPRSFCYDLAGNGALGAA